MAELCLGTVQFGMKYGINNVLGQPSEEEVFRILDAAVKHGIQVFDTAAAYGNAEEILGKYVRMRKPEKFRIVTKLAPGSVEHTEDISRKIYEEVCGSLQRLGMRKLYGYLLHNPDCLQQKEILDGLKNVKRDGMAEHIGVSIYHISEGETALKSGIVDFIQMSFNVFDQRGIQTGFLKRAKEKGITIFARSAFLQGLFMMEESKIPLHLEKSKRYLRELEGLLTDFQLDKVEALLNYPANHPYIDYVVIGVDNAAQLQEHTVKFGKKLPHMFLKRTEQMFGNVEEEIILPNLWRKA